MVTSASEQVVDAVPPPRAWFRRRRRFLFRPTTVGAVVALIALMICFAALNTGNNMIYLLASVLVSLVGCSVLITLGSIRGLSLSRRPPPECSVGDDAKVVLKITSSRRWTTAYAVTVADGAVSSQGRLTGRALAVRVAPRSTVRISYTIRPERRGEYHFGEALLASRYPFGLFYALRRFELPNRIIVYPRIGRLSPELIRRGQGWGSEKITRVSRRLGSDEFYGIREYRPGDNPRHIHWKSSARQSRLMLKEFDREEPLGYTVVLDSFVDPNNTLSLERFETAVSLTATLIDELARHGARIFLIAAMRDTEVLFNGRRSSISADVLRELALIQPAKEEDAARLRDTLFEYGAGSAHLTAVMLRPDSPLRDCLTPERAHGIRTDVIDVSDPRVIKGFDPMTPPDHAPA